TSTTQPTSSRRFRSGTASSTRSARASRRTSRRRSLTVDRKQTLGAHNGPRGLLDVDALTARYGSVQAVRDVSLRVGEGEIVALLGANGAGKTTTLASIAGLHQAK